MSHTELLCPTCHAPVPTRLRQPIGRVARYTCAACGEMTLHSELVQDRRLSRVDLIGGAGIPNSPVLLRPNVPTWGTFTMLAAGPYNQRIVSLGPIMDIPFPVSVIHSFRYGVDCVMSDPGGEMAAISCEVASTRPIFGEGSIGSLVTFPTTRAIHYTVPFSIVGPTLTAPSINSRTDMTVILRSMQFGLQDVSLTVYDAWIEVTFSP